jgi:Cys-rich repeat protein
MLWSTAGCRTIGNMASPRSYRLMWICVALAAFACGGHNNNGGPSNGTSVCGVNGTDACRTGQLCSDTLGCVQCNADSDCPATDPRCVEGSCVLCATNADCPAAMPACWADNRCHAACTTNTDCQQVNGGINQNLHCDTNSGDCIGCKTNADCAGTPEPLCDTTTALCVACLTNTDCGAAAPFCFLGSHDCVQCLSNADCGAARPVCSPDGFTCRTGCTTNADCGGTTPVCDTALDSCVQCQASTDCGSGAPVCDIGRGQCEVCLVNADCKDTTKPICSMQKGLDECVQCVKDTDCPTATPRCNNNVCGL